MKSNSPNFLLGTWTLMALLVGCENIAIEREPYEGTPVIVDGDAAERAKRIFAQQQELGRQNKNAAWKKSAE